ncbi:Tetratricopeptide repeat protein 1 [Blattella germanica]|nr:Tetratricopeptide repeat protein 1 [Blattella germanica]
MAEKQTDSCTGSTFPSNEEIINEITKDLSSCTVKSEENDRKIEETLGRKELDDSSASEVQNATGDYNLESDSQRDTEENITQEDDFIDEVALKDLEDTYNDDDREDLKPSAIEDCTKAIELNSEYLKAYFRRAQLYEETEKLDEALADYQKVLELDPLHREALYASKRLPEQILERNEKMKTEMMAKLKDLGNLILRPFGLSTENFQLSQDPNSGGYSVNFKQNPR